MLVCVLIFSIAQLRTWRIQHPIVANSASFYSFPRRNQYRQSCVFQLKQVVNFSDNAAM